MKVDAEIQQRVLALCGAKVSNGLKIAVRERFYQLKIKEIELEKAEEQFKLQQLKSQKELDEEVKQYSMQLDGLLKDSRVAAVAQVKSTEKNLEAAPEEEYSFEPEIITPSQAKQPVNAPVGARVRMQETIEDNSEELTDEDLPIEFVEGEEQR